MPKRAHSHSRVKSYSECPLQYKLLYVDKVMGEESDALQIGAAAHEFFDLWHKLLGTAIPSSRGQMKTDERLILGVAAKAFQKDPRDQKNFREFLAICKTFAKDYDFEQGWESESEVQLAFDANWLLTDWASPEAFFRAKLDRLDKKRDEYGTVRHIRITDYKTGFAGNPDPFQLDLYAMATAMVYPGARTVEIVFYYVKSGVKTTRILEVKDMIMVRTQLEALALRIDNDASFKAKPGARCLNCSVAAFCNAKPAGVKPLATLEEAEKMATSIAMLEAQEKAAKKSLKAWVEQAGPVNAQGLTFGFWPRESFDAPVDSLIHFCKANSLKFDTVLSSDTTAIKKLCKERPELASELAGIMTVETSQAFGSRRAESD